MPDYIAGAFAAFKPPPNLRVSEWSSEYRVLSGEASANKGKWRNENMPHLAEVMDAIHEPGVETIVGMMSSQMGKSECILNTIGYIISQDPAPIMLIRPDLDVAKRFSKVRLAPMIRDTRILTGLVVESKARDSGNTILMKNFPEGHIAIIGANSPSALSDVPIRFLIGDELDRFKETIEGDAWALGLQRTTNYPNRKHIVFSSPTIQDLSRIQHLYESGDRRRRHVPCWKCSYLQELKFANLKWEEGEPETAHFVCVDCKGVIEEKQKMGMLRAGVWVKERPTRRVASFAISQLYSPLKKWSEIIEKWEDEKDDPSTLRVFINTVLNETWEERGEAPEWEKVFMRRGACERGKIPPGGLLVTCGIDVQGDRIECELFAWGRDKICWSFDENIIFGDPNGDEIWQKLRQFLEKPIPCVGGHRKINLTAIDTGGHWTQKVYTFAREMGQERLMPVKGAPIDSAIGRPKSMDITMRGRIVKKGVQLWRVGTDILKKEIYSSLRMELADKDNPPPGYIFTADYDEEYYKQLTSEQLIKRRKKTGGWKYTFMPYRDGKIKGHIRNEVLDRHVYGRAAAVRLGIDRFTEKEWGFLERQVLKLQNQAPTAPISRIN